MQPTYNDGANVPPTPPPPFVALVANTLVRIIRNRNKITNQTLFLRL